MGRRLKYIDIKNFIEIESKSGCKLLTTEEEWSNFYSPTHHDIALMCSCGEQYNITYDRFKGKNKRICNKCSYIKTGERFSNINKKKYSQYIDDIKNRAKDEYIVLTKRQCFSDEKIKILLHNIRRY